MQPFFVRCDDGPDLQFLGKLVASAENSEERNSPDFSGSTGRRTTLNLYITEGGKYIGAQINHTRWVGERNSYSAKILEGDEAVIQFFGQGWLAKKLYRSAKIENVTTVE